ncbi:hypothetical protein KEM48_011078 [Puccinia striiformis f. sp. tritici PST-130]|nr:hypothetical protein KEM48_011078 [Puccinia striiformis f. sp. tritici PST-130]
MDQSMALPDIMSFKLLAATLTLLFIFNRHLDVQAAILRTTTGEALSPTAHSSPLLGLPKVEEAEYSVKFGKDQPDPLVIHDIDPNDKRLADRLRNFVHVDTAPVAPNFMGLVGPVMRGKESCIRETSSTGKYQWRSFVAEHTEGNKRLEHHLLKKLKWDKEYPAHSEPDMIDARLLGNDEWVKFVPAEYPVALPIDTQHDILYLRAPMTTEKSFELRENEEAGLEKHEIARNLMKMVDTDELLEATKTEFELGQRKPAATEAAAAEAAAEELQGESPELAREAMLWSGRGITELIAAKYPGRKFVWFRVNRLVRTHHLNEIHIFFERTAEEMEAAREAQSLLQSFFDYLEHLEQIGEISAEKYSPQRK